MPGAPLGRSDPGGHHRLGRFGLNFQNTLSPIIQTKSAMQRAAFTLPFAVIVSLFFSSCYGPLPPQQTNYLNDWGDGPPRYNGYAPRPAPPQPHYSHSAPYQRVNYNSSGQALRPRSFWEDMLLGARRFDIENAKKRAALGSKEDADFVRREEPIQRGFENYYGPQGTNSSR